MKDVVVALTFPDNAVTYEAYSKLGSSEAGDALVTMSLVERDDNGALTVREGADSQAGEGMFTGSLVGMLLGVLGGPIGLLLGWTAGAGIGALVDTDRLEQGGELLTRIGESVPKGRNAIVAEAHEEDPAVLDSFAKQFGGMVTRFDANEVVAELEAQQQAAEEANRAAREAVRAHKKQEREAKLHDRVAELREKFHLK